MVTSFASGREALLRATITVVARDGLRSLTYRSVAAEAGVSHGLVRHHFGTRDELLVQALEFAVTQSLASTSMLGEATTIDAFAEGIQRVADRDADLQAFQYELLLESRHRPELREHVERYYAAYFDANARALHALGVDDDVLIQTIWFALDGLVFAQLVRRADIEPVLQRIRRIIAEAAKPEP